MGVCVWCVGGGGWVGVCVCGMCIINELIIIVFDRKLNSVFTFVIQIGLLLASVCGYRNM